MTLSWPDDPEIRRAVASWGHMLDEALIADGGGQGAGLDWPEDDVIADTLAEWGALADRAIDKATALEDPALDPTIAWLGGSDRQGEVLVGSTTALPHDLDEARPVAAHGIRKHKVARPGQPATTTGWSVRGDGDVVEMPGVVVTAPRRAAASSRWGRTQPWGQVALVAAAAMAVLLVGGPHGASLRQQVGLGAGIRSGLPTPAGAGDGSGSGSGHGWTSGSNGGSTSGPGGSSGNVVSVAQPPAAGGTAFGAGNHGGTSSAIRTAGSSSGASSSGLDQRGPVSGLAGAGPTQGSSATPAGATTGATNCATAGLGLASVSSTTVPGDGGGSPTATTSTTVPKGSGNRRGGTKTTSTTTGASGSATGISTGTGSTPPCAG